MGFANPIVLFMVVFEGSSVKVRHLAAEVQIQMD